MLQDPLLQTTAEKQFIPFRQRRGHIGRKYLGVQQQQVPEGSELPDIQETSNRVLDKVTLCCAYFFQKRNSSLLGFLFQWAAITTQLPNGLVKIFSVASTRNQTPASLSKKQNMESHETLREPQFPVLSSTFMCKFCKLDKTHKSLIKWGW